MGGTLKAVLPFPVAEYQNDFYSTEMVLFSELLSHDPSPEIIQVKIPGNS